MAGAARCASPGCPLRVLKATECLCQTVWVASYPSDASCKQARDLLNGESAPRVYRDLRGMTHAALAEKAGVNRVTVAEIETGGKQGSVATLRALADALGVRMDDLAE